MEFGLYDWILLIVFLFALIYVYFAYKWSFFKRRGVKTPSILKGFVDFIFKREHFIDAIVKACEEFPEEKYIGMYQIHIPNLVIKDLDLIKQVTIKDFDHFQDHRVIIDEDMDPLFGKNLLSLKGQKWHEMRATLSPAFTSSKMKHMFEYVAECGGQMANYYSEKLEDMKDSEKRILEIEMKDAFSRYTNDVIATSAFGIKVDSLKERDNEFYSMGVQLTNTTTLQFMKMLFILLSPRLAKFLGMTLFGKKFSDFFRNLVFNQIKQREEKNIIRKDMIHLLMEARKGSLKHEDTSGKKDTGFAEVEEYRSDKSIVKRNLDDDDITAQAVLFFLAGFETSSTVLSFLANELAINPEIQKKLQSEIDEIYEKCGGKLKYDNLNDMKYTDMVVSETLRKWPPGPMTERICTKTYDLPPSTPSSKPYRINVNEGIWIPVCAIHRDPNYFKDPEKFDPERFSDENKSSILPFTYFPFGLGPRNCIGSRFALMEVKSVLFYLLKNFDIVEVSKTANPLKLNPKEFRIMPKNGFWVGLRKR